MSSTIMQPSAIENRSMRSMKRRLNAYSCANVVSPLIAANAPLGIAGGAGFCRVRLDMSDPGSRQSSPRSGRESTWRTVQILPGHLCMRCCWSPEVHGMFGGSAKLYITPPRQTTTSPRQPHWDSCISVQPAFLKPRSAECMNAVGMPLYTLRIRPNRKSAPT